MVKKIIITVSRQIIRCKGYLWLPCALFLCFAACRTARHGHTEGADRAAPVAEREFRAAWVATVANINWPSEPGLPVEEQQKEALDLLDFLQSHHFNAVIFQVRPQADALYKSDIEPWSFFLTGEQGKAPEPFYDPLQFWIEAAHARGLELHAWLNPYRAHHIAGGEVGETSVVKKIPGLVVELSEGYLWFDPSRKETREHSLSVVRDLVRRYDLDGIHFDDYFYPYPSYNGGEDFPDGASWNDYIRKGGRLSRGDWRRESVNSFIKEVYRTVKSEKPQVKFGLSPFGVWRPGHPPSVSGFDQYDQLYADARLWLNKGWMDYFAPQLYWKISKEEQSFPVLLGWWKGENHKGRHLWPGIRADLGGGTENINEVINQLMITRGMFPENPGIVHWSIAPLLKYPELSDALLQGPYRKKALVPASPWLNGKQPAPPDVDIIPGAEKVTVQWKHREENEIFRWAVYFKYGDGAWEYELLPGTEKTFELDQVIHNEQTRNTSRIRSVGVTAVDRYGNESRFLGLPVEIK